MNHLTVTLAIAVGVLASPVEAVRCVVRRQQAVAVQPVVVPVVADYYYQVSQSLQIEALIRKVVREELQTGLEAQSGPQPLPAIANNCAKCHSGTEPKGGITLDGLTPISPRILVKAQRAVLDERMPKDHPLSPELKGDVLQQLLDLVPKEESP